jgi:nitrite reductase/ring-hydroxylating ferredoxin subunit
MTRPAPTRMTLSDGTPLEDLIDIDTREVSMRLLSDPEIYSLELDRLWNRAWLIVCHASEIPAPGDFITRQLGADPVIVTRGRTGGVNVLLNVCAHRGMEVCRTEKGSARQFRCVYHGWVYDNTGAFRGAPVRKEQMHGDVYPPSELGLKTARVETYGGFVFATWDRDAPSLDDWLGDIKWYYDLLLCRTAGGMEVLGPPQRYVIDANWKTAGEQAAGDGFHTLTLHRSLLEIGAIGGAGRTSGDQLAEMAPAMYGVDVSAEGHGLRCIPLETIFTLLMGTSAEGLATMDRLRRLPPAGLTQEMVEDLPNRFTPDQLRLLAECPPQVGGMFPNMLVAFIHQPTPYQPSPGAPPEMKLGAALTIHTYLPRGVGELEFVNYILVEKDAPQELKDEMLRVSVHGLGTSGTVEQDDAEAWPSMTRAARGGMGRRQTMKYQALLGEKRPAGWPGGGHVYEGFTKDDNQWLWWLRYRDFILGKA